MFGSQAKPDAAQPEKRGLKDLHPGPGRLKVARIPGAFSAPEADEVPRSVPPPIKQMLQETFGLDPANLDGATATIVETGPGYAAAIVLEVGELPPGRELPFGPDDTVWIPANMGINIEGAQFVVWEQVIAWENH